MDFEQANEWEQAQRQQIAGELPAELSAAAPARDWQPATGSDPLATCVDRRVFLRGGAGLIGGAAMAGPLQEFMGRAAYGAAVPSPYGEPEPAIDESTGLALIKLPPGFRYFSYGWRSDPLTGGASTPAAHDGMAVIAQVGPRLVLCRNQEVAAATPFFNGAIRYAPGGGGGNVNLIFNTQTERFEKAWPSLSGCVRNCAGGVTPWGTWLSCEESFSTSGSGANLRTHGWVFEVPAFGAASPVPYQAMGRFSHEAVVVDPATGYVYETEDAGDNSGFYRFVPNVYGKLGMGGTLQMLKVAGTDKFDFRGALPVPTTWDVEWVTIADPDGSPTSCFNQGFNANAARFRRLEGCWYGSGRIYFLSTSGGVVTEGQVFEYDPVAETLTIIYDAGSFAEVSNPDNMVVTPRGGFILCEDQATGGEWADGARLVGLTPSGGTFNFAVNRCDFRATALGSYTRPSGRTFNTDLSGEEWAGACYSPDGQWLFANLFNPGATLAITGPWGAGPL